MYNVASDRAAEFISDDEIIDTIAFAEKNKNNEAYLLELLEKAEQLEGLSHREALCLLESDSKEIEKRIFELAYKIKLRNYGNRIVMFAPLYLSNYCVNGCTYCPYHGKNKHIARKKLSQEDIKREVIALENIGHKRLAIETGEHPIYSPIEYVLESIKTIYNVHHKNGDIRRVNVNIAATSIENYKKLKEAGIGTYILFQETYNKENYEKLHVYGPKSGYAYHTEAMDRAMAAGIDDVGIGVLYGLEYYKYDFVGLLMHKEHLEVKFGVGPHTISVPRLRPASEVNVDDYDNGLSDEKFIKLVAVLRISVPYTGIIVSTREDVSIREKLLNVGISQISGGSRTSVGGYADNGEVEDSTQFEVADTRSLDDVVYWLMEHNHIPSFCTACYRSGRVGDRFMRMVKSGAIANVCGANALITLMEYLCDYASEKTYALGQKLIDKEVKKLPSEVLREKVKGILLDVKNGKRDFRI